MLSLEHAFWKLSKRSKIIGGHIFSDLDRWHALCSWFSLESNFFFGNHRSGVKVIRPNFSWFVPILLLSGLDTLMVWVAQQAKSDPSKMTQVLRANVVTRRTKAVNTRNR